MIYRRVRDIAAIYGLDWLLRQETAHENNVLDRVSDGDLIALLNTMERAREACDDEVPLHELGLIRRTIQIGMDG